MPIQLDKILADIAEEKALHPNFPQGSKSDIDDAWLRVGHSNKLSVHEARSIFKVLQKKYDQEKLKPKSAWKLFSLMEQIHQKDEGHTEIKDDLDEDEEYEMLEVQEDEQAEVDELEASKAANEQQKKKGFRPLQVELTGKDKLEGFSPGVRRSASRPCSFASDNESPGKSMKSHSSGSSPEKEDRPTPKQITAPEEKKLLNTMASASPRPATGPTSTQTQAQATAAALHKKGITMKKTTSLPTSTPRGTSQTQAKQSGPGTFLKIMRPVDVKTEARGNPMLEMGKTIQLPDSIKRKLCEDQGAPQVKKINLSQGSTTVARQQPVSSAPTQLVQIKQEAEDPSLPPVGINIITLPPNSNRADQLANGFNNGGTGGCGTSSTAATVASTSTNGFSPRMEDSDFRNGTIFDIPKSAANKVTTHGTNTLDIINLGNFDNTLPPTFFKNLCNSSRYEALGLYVANVMNRLRPRSAAKLELGILRAVIDIQSDEFEQ